MRRKTMQLQVHPKNKSVPINDDVRRYLEKRLSRLNKLFRREPEAQVTQNFERGQHIVEITLDVDGALLRSQERHSDLPTAIDKVVDKLETQWKRFKEKRIDGHRQPSAIKTDAEVAAENAENGFAPVIVKRKKFAMETL